MKKTVTLCTLDGESVIHISYSFFGITFYTAVIAVAAIHSGLVGVPA